MLIFYPGNGLKTSNCKSSVPKWPDSYEVKGTLIIPYAELVEPFYGW